MIKKIQLKNFRTFGNLEFEFADGLNAITGDTYAGKSNLLRAIRWVVQNEPAGNDMIRRGEKTCGVTLLTDDGQSVTRAKNPGNSYDVNGKKLQAFGRKTPSDVDEVLRIHELSLPTNAGQFEMPFLFGMSSGDVSRLINSIVDLETVSQTVTNAVRNKNEIRTQKKNIQETLEEINTEIKSLPDIEKAATILSQASKYRKQRKKIILKRGELSDAVESAKTKKLPDVDLNRITRRIEKRTTAIQKLEQLTAAITNVETTKQNLQNAIANLNEAKMETPNICSECGQQLP